MKDEIYHKVKGDRNEVARQNLEVTDLQTRRRYLDLMMNVKHSQNAIILNQEYLTKMKVDLNTAKEEDKRKLEIQVYDMENTIEQQRKTIDYIKEDIFHLLKGRDIKIFEDSIKKHYDEVNEFFNKNFENVV